MIGTMDIKWDLCELEYDKCLLKTTSEPDITTDTYCQKKKSKLQCFVIMICLAIKE